RTPERRAGAGRLLSAACKRRRLPLSQDRPHQAQGRLGDHAGGTPAFERRPHIGGAHRARLDGRDADPRKGRRTRAGGTFAGRVGDQRRGRGRYGGRITRRQRPWQRLVSPRDRRRPSSPPAVRPGVSIMAKTALHFRHNGRDVAIFVDGGTNLLVALREVIGDMTPKFGCGQGGCGACSVLVDGELHLSCLTLAETVAGRSVETLDGIKNGPELHPLQRAFADNFAAQCGYCTPGMLMAAKALLDRNPSPSRAEVVEAI